MMEVFRDRHDAGRRLAEKLHAYADRDDVLVLALPRGGVPVGFEVAQRLDAPLDVFLVRKLGVPGHEELAMGAIATGGVRVLNDDVIESLGIPRSAIDMMAAREQRELERRERLYRGSRPVPEIAGRTTILVDDGLATGSTMWAAVAALRERHAGDIVVAVPVAAPETCQAFREAVAEIVCLLTPERLQAVGLWYEDFSATTDEEVRALLERSKTRAVEPLERSGDGIRASQPRPIRSRGEPHAAEAATSIELGDRRIAGNNEGPGSGGRIEEEAMRGNETRPPDSRTVHVPVARAVLEGELASSVDARGVILFAHGSGSSRHSVRNRRVALALQRAGFATLLVDLLTLEEESVDVQTARLRFDVDLLALRLVGVTDWVIKQPEARGRGVGYFGASTGAAAALVAAARRPEEVWAVVSRGGRPDLAGPALPKVRAPTLLIVGGDDVPVIAINERALAELRCEKRLEIVPRATHLFEEPGALDRVARLATEWFRHHVHASVASQE